MSTLEVCFEDQKIVLKCLVQYLVNGKSFKIIAIVNHLFRLFPSPVS